MRFLRPFIFAIVLASAFFYFTTYRNGRLHPADWISHPQHVEITEAAGSEALDAEEQNNISVYRKNIGSVVNITSRVMTFDFFYGLGPAGRPGLRLRHRQRRTHPHQLSRHRRCAPGRSHAPQPQEI